MPDDTTDLDVKDIKKPKQLAKKLGRIGLLGIGAIAQEFLSSQLLSSTEISQNIVSGGEVILSGVASGYTKNKYARSFLNGIMAGASKDFVSNIVAKIKEGNLFGNLKSIFSKPQASQQSNSNNTPPGDSCYV